jgi:hypothetical protein
MRTDGRLTLILVAWTAAVSSVAQPASKTLEEVIALMAKAKAEGRVQFAHKTRPVEARPAKPGEVVVTVIKGEGKETQSKPAKAGDWVVRNRCPQTGNEQYLVSADKFPGRYQATGAAAAPDGWQEFRPVGKRMRFVVLRPADGPFSFTAPWGEAMVARPGDAMVQDPEDQKDVYRVAKASFECTYQVTE